MRRLLAWSLLAGWAAGCGPALVWEGRMPGRRDLLRVVEARAGQRVELASQPGRWYAGIGVEELTTSSDGRHLAYPARAGDAWTVVVDGHELGRWSGVGELRFSPTGERLAFSVERDGHWQVMRDGSAGPWLDTIFAESLQWSKDGSAIAYAGTRGGLAHVVWQDRLGPAFDGVARLVLGARGGRLLYAGRRAGAWHVVDGQQVGPPHEIIGEITASPDEQHVAYLWRDGAREGLMLDGVGLPAYEGGHLSAISVDDEGRLTFIATRADAACVVRHGVAQALHAQIANLVVTATGRYAYVARGPGAWQVVVDGAVRATADAVEDLIASPDGRRFLCLLRRGQRWSVGCDGAERGFDRVVAGSLAFGRDSRHWGVIAGDARSRDIFIAVDGIARRPFDLREMVFLAEKRPAASPAEATATLRAVVAAEVDLATEEARP